MDELYVPEIEAGIPIPASALEALPELDPTEELNMRARTIKLLSDMTGAKIAITENETVAADRLARQMMTDPKYKPDFATYPNEMVAYLAGMVAQMNCSIVEELAELKTYVINKLVHAIEHPENQKNQLSALRALGEIDGVDAFKRRSETTINIKPIQEVEKELHNILNAIDGEVTEVKPSHPSLPAPPLRPYEAGDEPAGD
jgi:hypothetical protein